MATNFNFTGIIFTRTNNFYFADNTFNIISGNSSIYTSIWADDSANINSGKVYIGSYGSGAALSVIDLSTKVLVDSYLIDKAGAFNESLDNEYIVDININLAGA